MYEVSILGASLFQSVQYKFLKRKKKEKIKTDQSQMTVVIKEKKNSKDTHNTTLPK